MNKEAVIARIDDWERRLNALFARVDEWYRELPSNPVKDSFAGSVLQIDEDLMRQCDVPPRMLPTRSIVYGRNRLLMVPSALWIIGANGRVNLATHAQNYVLVDLGGTNGEPSDWQVVTSRLRHVHRPFDRQVFRNLVLYQAVEAA